MKKIILFLFISISLFSEAQVQMSQVNGLIPKLNSKQDTIFKGTGFLKRSGAVWSYDNSTYQPSIYGVGFIKANGSTISYDPQTYLTIEALSPYSTTNQANAMYEPKFSQGYANQYLRGDKTWKLFPTSLSSFTNDLGNYGGWITGINSGMVTTALGYTPEQPLTFSTGLTRTGNAITNNITQYTDALARSAQTNSSITTALGYTPWYSGNHPTTIGGYGITDYNTSSQFNSTASTGTAPFTVNSTTMVNNLKAQYLGTNIIVADANLQKITGSYYYNTGSTNVPFIGRLLHQSYNEAGYNGQIMTSEIGNRMAFRTQTDATWNPWNEVYHSGNLTNNLSTNYIPKWNGSSFVNSLISDDGSYTRSTNYKIGSPSNGLLLDWDNNSGLINIQPYGSSLWTTKISTNGGNIQLGGISSVVTLHSTTSSTSPTTGALVTPGGIGVGGVSHFADDIIASSTIQASEFVKSGGTASQFLKANGSVDSNTYQQAITLTTSGTSGTATFSGNTLNIPNYSNGSILNQNSTYQSANFKITGSGVMDNLYAGTASFGTTTVTGLDLNCVQHHVSGSISGYAEFQQPMIGGGGFKKVIIYLVNLVGSSTWNFDRSFTYTPVIVTTSGLPSSKITSLSNTSITVTGANESGYLTIEGR